MEPASTSFDLGGLSSSVHSFSAQIKELQKQESADNKLLAEVVSLIEEKKKKFERELQYVRTTETKKKKVQSEVMLLESCVEEKCSLLDKRKREIERFEQEIEQFKATQQNAALDHGKQWKQLRYQDNMERVQQHIARIKAYFDKNSQEAHQLQALEKEKADIIDAMARFSLDLVSQKRSQLEAKVNAQESALKHIEFEEEQELQKMKETEATLSEQTRRVVQARTKVKELIADLQNEVMFLTEEISFLTNKNKQLEKQLGEKQ